MSEHPNVTVINRMTKAVFENDRDTLVGASSPTTWSFHVRGPLPRPGDHTGVDGFLEALGAIFELTDGDVKIEQLFCNADGALGGRVGARRPRAQRSHARGEQHVRLPVRRGSDRRDVDDLRGARRQRVLLGLTPAAMGCSASGALDETPPWATGSIEAGTPSIVRRGAARTSSCRRPHETSRSRSRISSGSRRRPTSSGTARRARTSGPRRTQECARIGEVARAARCAFWLAFTLLNNGELGSRRGLGRPRRSACSMTASSSASSRDTCATPRRLRACYRRCGARPTGFREAVGIGERYRDPELTALARIGDGRCLIYLGEIDEGVALLDEAMVAVGAKRGVADRDGRCVLHGDRRLPRTVRRSAVRKNGPLPSATGAKPSPNSCCTEGECLVHRAEIMLLHGTWTDALRELEQALARLSDPAGQRTLGPASYLRGELHRLRGDFEEADAFFRMAHEAGRRPQPGVALLRLAQGRVDVADATIRRTLGESEDPLTRGRLLGAFVEIVLAAGDVDAARVAADELAVLATDLHQPVPSGQRGARDR